METSFYLIVLPLPTKTDTSESSVNSDETALKSRLIRT